MTETDIIAELGRIRSTLASPNLDPHESRLAAYVAVDGLQWKLVEARLRRELDVHKDTEARLYPKLDAFKDTR